MSTVILASASKTRAAMLRSAGVPFGVQEAHVDEPALKSALLEDGAPARLIAEALAEAKARSVSLIHPDALVIGADQILVQDGTVFSKADTRAKAEQTLAALSGRTHDLYSSAVIYQQGQAVWRVVSQATLAVRPLSATFIKEYLDTLGEDAFWSVGCYQLEGLGAQLFTSVKGDHFTVLGLPLLAVLDFLRGIDILKK